MNRRRLQKQSIRNHLTGAVIYDGFFPSLLACAEQAVADGVALDGADFTDANLVNARLDDARLKGSSFRSANLMGANLSEAVLDAADFSDAGLQNACLCFTSLRYARFAGALFGATDIAGADITGSVFSTLSALSLNFRDTADMQACVFEDREQRCYPLTRPPVVIHGLTYPVIFMDSHVGVGPVFRSYAELLRSLHGAGRGESADGALHSFLGHYSAHLPQLIAAFRPENRANF